ncbi:MAG: flagellar hook-basal body complex protein FliE [Aminipila sp.]
MFIEPIQAISNIVDVNKVNKLNEVQPQEGVQVPFKSIFEGAVQDVISTDKQVNIDAEMLATGQSDNLHQYSIDIAKAQLSMDLLVELRNKAMESYSEVMRMSI